MFFKSKYQRFPRFLYFFVLSALLMPHMISFAEYYYDPESDSYLDISITDDLRATAPMIAFHHYVNIRPNAFSREKLVVGAHFGTSLGINEWIKTRHAGKPIVLTKILIKEESAYLVEYYQKSYMPSSDNRANYLGMLSGYGAIWKSAPNFDHEYEPDTFEIYDVITTSISTEDAPVSFSRNLTPDHMYDSDNQVIIKVFRQALNFKIVYVNSLDQSILTEVEVKEAENSHFSYNELFAYGFDMLNDRYELDTQLLSFDFEESIFILTEDTAQEEIVVYLKESDSITIPPIATSSNAEIVPRNTFSKVYSTSSSFENITDEPVQDISNGHRYTIELYYDIEDPYAPVLPPVIVVEGENPYIENEILPYFETIFPSESRKEIEEIGEIKSSQTEQKVLSASPETSDSYSKSVLFFLSTIISLSFMIGSIVNKRKVI